MDLQGRCSLGVALALFILVGSLAHSQAHLPTSTPPPPANAQPAPLADPLGRETPRSALMGLLKYTEREDYETAARYLQPSPTEKTDLPRRARELRGLFSKFKGSVGLLSDDPNGTVEPGLPPGQVRAGVMELDSNTTDVILVRVSDPAAGQIWLLSKETVATIPKLHALMAGEAPTLADRIMPVALTSRRMLGMSLAQWLGWLLSIPLSLLLAVLMGFVISVPSRIRCKIRNLPFLPVWETRLGMPLTCIMAILIHGVFVYLLQPPLLYRVYYVRFLATLLVVGFVWLVSRITDRGFEHAVHRTRVQNKGGEAILVMMQRLTRIVLVIVAVIGALTLFGFNVKTTLAGLGIGGLAIALAAQKTLENLIGGVSLLMDDAVHVGDFCKIGDQLGTVEDIGLRSLKLRTLDQNILVVPNGSLAQMEFQNMSRRPKLLISQTFALRIETRVEQLQFVLEHVQKLLNQHPGIEPGTSRVRVTSFAGASFAMELFAYGTTSDWTQLTTIRQDIILHIAEIVESSGARFAGPTQVAYLSRESGIDAEKAADVVRRVAPTEARRAAK